MASGPPEVQVIRPSSGWVGLDWRELWRFRELLYFLTWRDISVRYKQTALGVAWAVLQPLFTMIVFSIFFGVLGGLNKKVDKVDGLEVPYYLFVFCGLLPLPL